jgi:cytidyltransferase-like protein
MMKVGFKSGAFALFHAGHSWMLDYCKERCDYLIVLMNDDEYIMRKKGIVIMPWQQRMRILEGHRAVDEVYEYSGDNEHQWLEEFKYGRAYGTDTWLRLFHSAELIGRSWVPGQGIVDEIVYVPKQSSPVKVSVSEIFAKIRG